MSSHFSCNVHAAVAGCACSVSSMCAWFRFFLSVLFVYSFNIKKQTKTFYLVPGYVWMNFLDIHGLFQVSSQARKQERSRWSPPVSKSSESISGSSLWL